MLSQKFIAAIIGCSQQNVSHFKGQEKQVILSSIRRQLIPKPKYHLNSSVGTMKRARDNSADIICSTQKRISKVIREIYAASLVSKVKGGRPIQLPTEEDFRRLFRIKDYVRITKKYLPRNFDSLDTPGKLTARIMALFQRVMEVLLNSLRDTMESKRLTRRRIYITNKVLDSYWIPRWIHRKTKVVPIQFKNSLDNSLEL